MSSFPRNLFPITFKRPNPGDESPYHVDTTKLFLKDEDESDSKERKETNCLVPTWWRSYFADSEMNIYRLFYFLFNAAMALFAYLPLYYKQSLLLDNHHVGILMGIRPICKFLAAPCLGSLADKFNKYKSFLYGGLLTYIIIYLSVTFVSGVPGDCGQIDHQNVTNATLLASKTLANEARLDSLINKRNTDLLGKTQDKNERKLWDDIVGNSTDFTVDLPIQENVEETAPGDFSYYDNLTTGSRMDIASENSWPLDVYVWKTKDTTPAKLRIVQERLFTILLLLTIVAEVVGAPILSLADTATLQNLRKEPYKYGYQSVWGSVGFGLMSVVFGSILHFTVSVNEDVRDCPEKTVHKYRPVFYGCCFLLVLSFISTLKFHFREYEGKNINNGCSFFKCVKYFGNIEYSLFVFLAWFTGLAHGLSLSFIYVHLMRVGATPLILLITALSQSISKIIFYLLSPTLIVKYGYFPVIYAGLITNAVVFFSYSFLETPWMAVPIELLSGISTSCTWAAMVSYVGAPPKTGATLQGILHSIHYGLGSGIGGIFGGLIIVRYGFAWLFRSFSLAALFVFLMVFGFRYWRKQEVEPIWKKLWDYSPLAFNEDIISEDE